MSLSMSQYLYCMPDTQEMTGMTVFMMGVALGKWPYLEKYLFSARNSFTIIVGTYGSRFQTHKRNVFVPLRYHYWVLPRRRPRSQIVPLKIAHYLNVRPPGTPNIHNIACISIVLGRATCGLSINAKALLLVTYFTRRMLISINATFFRHSQATLGRSLGGAFSNK